MVLERPGLTTVHIAAKKRWMKQHYGERCWQLAYKGTRTVSDMVNSRSPTLLGVELLTFSWKSWSLAVPFYFLLGKSCMYPCRKNPATECTECWTKTWKHKAMRRLLRPSLALRSVSWRENGFFVYMVSTNRERETQNCVDRPEQPSGVLGRQILLPSDKEFISKPAPSTVTPCKDCNPSCFGKKQCCNLED